jgi:hypothetical protein
MQILTTCHLALVLVAVSAAQGSLPAGGKWTYHAERDQMTDTYWHVFKLKADQEIVDGVLAGMPEFSITCGKGWRDSQLTVPVIIASDSVEVRADGKSHMRTWSVAQDRKAFFVDGSNWLDMRRVPATKEILRSKDIRVKFEAYPGHYFVVQFSPAGINREMLLKACGSKFATEK